jgi:hypothetical protein
VFQLYARGQLLHFTSIRDAAPRGTYTVRAVRYPPGQWYVAIGMGAAPYCPMESGPFV